MSRTVRAALPVPSEHSLPGLSDQFCRAAQRLRHNTDHSSANSSHQRYRSQAFFQKNLDGMMGKTANSSQYGNTHSAQTIEKSFTNSLGSLTSGLFIPDLVLLVETQLVEVPAHARGKVGDRGQGSSGHVLHKARAARGQTDKKTPRSAPQSFVRQGHKVLHSIGHVPRKGRGTAEHIETANNPTSLEESAREVVARETVTKTVPGGPHTAG